jgi:cardiolipin synthase
MNLPNLLTILRILLVPVFINLLIYKLYPPALGVFLLASFTDGLTVSLQGLQTNGPLWAPILIQWRDKLLLTAAFITLSVLQFIPVWVSVIVVSRDIILVLGAMVLPLAQANSSLHRRPWVKPQLSYSWCMSSSSCPWWC